MFSLKHASMLVFAIVLGFAAVFVYVNSSALQAGEPDNHEMIATTDKAVWHLKDGRLRYCIIRSSEIFCIQEK